MFANYLVTSLRNIARHKISAVINIAGLALGFACIIAIALYIRDELSFDSWVPGNSDLYRVEETLTLPGRSQLRTGLVDFPLLPLMKDNIPEVASFTHFWPTTKTVTVSGRPFLQNIAEVDPNFFQVIRFPLLAGDTQLALSRPDGIVLTKAIAIKLFGVATPIGRTLNVNVGNCPADTISCANEVSALVVTGVMDDLPYNTHMRIEALIPHNSPADRITEEGKRSYFNLNGYGYIRLVPGADPARILNAIPKLLDGHVNVAEDLGMKLQASKAMQVSLDPFTQVHLASGDRVGNLVAPGSKLMLFGLAAIGALLLLIACFNFTNIATARALTRAREISLRKCVGAQRSQIAAQFLGEAVLTALLALVLGLALAEMLMPALAHYLGRPLTFSYPLDWPLLLIVVAIAVFAGLIGGAYPAFVLSRFRPARVLRANSASDTGSPLFRSVLVVLQFAVAIGLGIASVVIFAQVDFSRGQKLGFRFDNIVEINTFRRMTDGERAGFVASLRSSPDVLETAMSSDIPFSGSATAAQMRLPGRQEYLTMERQAVTPELFHLYDMQLLSGRMLSETRGADKLRQSFPTGMFDGLNIIINQAAASRLGFSPQGAINQTVMFGPYHVHIVGVLADAMVYGARTPAPATVYTYDPFDSGLVSVRVSAGRMSQAIQYIDQSWRRFAPNVAIQRGFLDEAFARLYSADEEQAQMFGGFVAIAIVTASLGLFGLTFFNVSQRAREISLRKVFGARTRDVALLLLWQFSLPVLLANIIAWPIAWYYLRNWLQGFSYRITLSPIYFAAVGALALAIAWATIFGVVFRVARALPIGALRRE